MNNIIKGIIAGTIFGIVSIAPMFFMTLEDKPRAIAASFISRFSTGFIIFNMDLPFNSLIKGGLVGLFLSLPDALITKKYTPILGLGLVGGIVCGLFVQ